ncbi:topoisomerase DNA-binding C4 zinc finger domain-containing protein [Clostridium perfringens]|uniref:topoisomerase DNA-binding C4 zinc finger domain-containing protein n=1 Tax=Clostridium perfringens TaxID=1502 RepID=UPI0039E76BD6
MSEDYITCPTCGSIMKKRSGYYGDFYGCSKYPECTTTVNIKDVDEKFHQVINSQDGENFGKCARCGELATLSSMGYCSYCQHVWDND